MLKLVVFDCDGVLFDSREANRVYYNQLLAHFGCPLMSEEDIGYVHMHNVADSIRHIFRKHRQISMEAVSSYAQSLDYTPYLQHMLMAPDLKQFLGIITPHCHRAISTNRTTSMDLILDIFGLREHFEMVMTAANAPRPKPAPDALYVILDHFQLKPEEAVFIGDSTVDQAHSAAAGVDLIAFANPALDARWHVASFLEILALPPFTALGLTA
ncbi:HAD family hydrolase [Candidatus Electronema sp. PJ]|uniref:HAD family hydrolase n=1 Tax=Candidatus Electronema sp. PJ TaxID=3401572 RepID=UPI003AA806D0